MPLQDYIKDRRNKILIGGSSAVGIAIVAATITIFNTWVRPAYLVTNPKGERLIEISDHGAIGTGTGTNAFGSAGDCLKSGGGSGKMMSFGTCGSGGGGSGVSSGSVVVIGDQRYVKKQGDVMTGTLVISNSKNLQVAGTISGNTLKIIGTGSGGSFHAEKSLSTSGTLVFEGAASGSSLYIASSLNGVGLTACTGANKIQWNNGRFSCVSDPDTNTTYTAAKGLTLLGTAFALNDTITGSSLRISGTVSGALAIFSSLRNCTLKTSNTGNVLCGIDINTQFSNTGSLYTYFNTQYVKKSGDTMTGALNVRSNLSGSSLFTLSNYRTCTIKTTATGMTICGTDIDTNTTYQAGQGLTLTSTAFKVNSVLTGSLVSFTTVSGSIIKAKTSLASSGALTWEGAGSGASLYIGGTFEGAGLVSCSNGVTSKLLWDSTAKRFSCGTDQSGGAGTTYFAGQGLTLSAGNAFSVNATLTGSAVRFNSMSGSVVHAEKLLSSSGSLKVLSNISGSTLNVNSLVSCTNIQTNASGRLACNSTAYLTADQTQAGQGLTLNGTALKVNSTLTGSLVSFTTLSGSVAFLNPNLSNPTYAQGKVFYDATNKTLAYYNDEADVTMNIGQEDWIRVRNNNSYTIRNGQVVFINGSASGVPTINLARSNTGSTASAVGFATHDIEGSTFGYVTAFGVVHSINTNTFATGATVYLSPTTSGSYTTTRPIQPNMTVELGKVVAKGTTTGSILAQINGSRAGALTTGAVPFGGPSGATVQDAVNFFFDDTNNRLGIGTAAPDTGLEVIGTISGSLITSNGLGNNYLRGNLGIGGEFSPTAQLEVWGTMSGSGLFTLTGYRNCTLKTSATGSVICGVDNTGGAGGGGNFVLKSGDTMTGALVIQSGNTAAITSIPLLNIRGTMSGRGLIISGTGSSRPLLLVDQTTRKITIGGTGTGNIFGTQTGQTLGTFSIIDGLGKAIFRVFGDGRVWAGQSRAFTGALELGTHPVMGRRTGFASQLLITDTSLTSIGIGATTGSGNGSVPTISSNRIYTQRAAPNTTGGFGGFYSSVLSETRPDFQPRFSLAMRTGTGVTNMSYFFGMTNNKNVGGSADTFSIASSAAVGTGLYAGLAWESGINGNRWMCCSADASNKSCKDMGLPVSTSTDYLLSMDFINSTTISCSIISGNTVTRVTKTDLLPISGGFYGWYAGLRQRATGNNGRAWYFGKVSIDQN